MNPSVVRVRSSPSEPSRDPGSNYGQPEVERDEVQSSAQSL